MVTGRFHDITWVQPKEGYERGIIAGALENGSLDLWDAGKLLEGAGSDTLSMRTVPTNIAQRFFHVPDIKTQRCNQNSSIQSFQA